MTLGGAGGENDSGEVSWKTARAR